MNVHFALLARLATGPRSGPRLRDELGTGPGGPHPPDAGQVDSALARLERAGLVEPAGSSGAEDPRPEFRITAGGWRELAGWLRTTPDPAAPLGDELVQKILLAGQVPGTDVHEVIQAHRRCLIQRMQRCTRMWPAGAGPPPGPALARYAELCRLDSVIRWLDAADGLLGRDDPVTHGGSLPPADEMLASDLDRELALAGLRDHFAAGRLSYPELDERLTAALSARTAGDLRRIMADLPGCPPRGTAPRSR
ncbi:MAG TPA: DUF1707 domain-containing protein [Streptosporangiaceae bacterium]|nr:DUF1707 domain-containing protein [Streptosporangiaceae bacterium]